MATVADLIVHKLAGAGVRALFGVPGGGGNLDLIAAASRAGLPFVLTSTETAAAIAALAQAEITGAPGACLTTLGPGATSVVNGVACAFLERAPLLVFTDSQAASAGHYAHQRIDHRAVMQPVTKWSETLSADGALHTITRALHAAMDGRPGPVHLDCPGDVAAAPTETRGGTLVGSVRSPLTRTDRGRLETLLARSRRPLVMAGLGVRQGIADFCERHRVPALVTYKAKGVIPDDHAWFGGVFTNAALEQPLIDDSDLLIGVGLDPVELIPRAWKRTQPIVYLGPWRVEDGHVGFDLQMLGSLDEHLALLDAALRPTDWDSSVVAQHVQRQRDRVARQDDAGFTAQRVVGVAARTLASIASRVTVDAGAHMFPTTVLWPVYGPNQMLISNGLSTMGFALPAAVGAALLDRQKPVVALTGDGGLLMCLGELLTAVRERLPIVTIVFADDALSLIEIKQQARTLPPAGVALGVVDWQAIARGFGVRAFGASNGCELERVIGAALEHRGPALIEARIDRSNYGATLRAVRG
jgi:acetolactate synthase-1/2/3 large subunit